MRMQTVMLLMLAVMLATISTVATSHAQEEPKPEAKPAKLTAEERKELEAKAKALNAEMMRFYGQGNASDALKAAAEVLSIRKKLHVGKDHPDLAQSLSNMGSLLRAMGQSEKALPFFQQALDMYKRLFKDQDHPSLATSLNNMGILLQTMGQSEKALPFFQQALDMTERLFKDQNHPHLAQSLNNMGYLLQAMGRSEKALPFYQQALDMYKRLFKDQDHPDLANSLNNMGGLLQAMGQSEKALPFFQQALDMRKRLFKDQGHPDLAVSLNNMGVLLQAMGQSEKALPFFQQAFDMKKRLFKNQDHNELARSLNNMGVLLTSMGQSEKALPFSQQALDMRKRLFKDQDHPDLAASLNNMGTLFSSMGQSEKALSFLQQALGMQKRLFRDQDHPDLARSLNNMGYLLDAMGQYEKAMPFYQQALDMNKRLFKDQDHPELARSLNNMGTLLDAMGQYEKALPFYQQALDMNERLFKDQDHPELARSLNNTGGLLASMGQSEKAFPFTHQALDMYKRLFKDQNHHHLAYSLINMGTLLDAMGEYEKALPFTHQALDMQRHLGDRFAYSNSLADALDYLAQFPNSRSAYLSTSRPFTKIDAHAVVWSQKATLAQLYRARRALTIARQSEQLDDLRGQLRFVQRQLSGVIATPADPKRDAELADLTDRQSDLERQIARLLPDWQPLADVELGQLLAALKPGDVFLDLYRHDDWISEKQRWGGPRYVAFVATSEGSRRVELGPAEPIETAVEEWRRALVRWHPDSPIDTTRLAARVHALLWQPLQPHLPPDTRRVFVCPDGDLGRVPFAALPDATPGSILLERLTFATIESGPDLLQRLTKPRPARTGEDALLVTGGVQYDPPGSSEGEPWGFLTGSEKELRDVRQLWGTRGTAIVATGHDATTAWLLENLPKVRYAHLATHGQFDASEYAREQVRLADARTNLIAGQIGDGSRIGLGVKNPLGYVGVVMAGANAPTAENPDRGVLAGTSIWPMDLTGLDLVILSACQTGLGRNTGSAGVANLTLAFHIAGCRNVIASLWDVPDAATAALMTRFYQALWDEKKTPLEALREAQLFVWRHPEVAMNWDTVVKRGKVEEALRAPKKVAATLPNGGKHLLDEPMVKGTLPGTTPAKYWAAFVLSGLGE